MGMQALMNSLVEGAGGIVIGPMQSLLQEGKLNWCDAADGDVNKERLWDSCESWDLVSSGLQLNPSWGCWIWPLGHRLV